MLFVFMLPLMLVNKDYQKFRDIRPISRYMSQTIQDSAMVTIEGE